MEKGVIIKRFTELKTKEELLLLLNDIVKEELGREKAFTFSIKQLTYYCNPNNIKGRYHHFSIPKKSGGKRNIAAPSSGLRNILHYVNVLLKAVYQPSDYAMGFVEGRCVLDNANRHIGQNYVFNTDLENFFPSIVQPRVWKRMQLPPFNLCQPIANIIAGLCCIKEINEDGTFEYVLPQGAPTSPLITNAICDTLDRRLSGLARRYNLHYSRYADDITFSSMHNVYQKDGDFFKELKRIIEGQNFKINDAKTRLQKLGERQEVTGLTVGKKVNVSSSYIAEIRNLLHIWEKYGYKEAYKRFYKRYKVSKGYIKKGEPLLENVLYGKLQYLKMVKGEKDSVYSSLQSRYDKLTSPINPDKNQKYDYLRSFTLAQFEEIVGESICYTLSKAGNIYGTICLNKQPIVISITNAAKVQLIKNKIITDESLIASLKSDKYCIPVNSKPGLYIVLTANKGKKPFWMMTYYDPTSTEIDLASIPVSELLDLWEEKGLDFAINAYEDSVLGIETYKKDASNVKNNKITRKHTKKKSFNLEDLGLTVEDISAIEKEIRAGEFQCDVDLEDESSIK